jgi:CHAT domain-containing protein
MGRPAYEKNLSDLPATESEVKALGQLFGEQATLFMGPEASESKAKAEMGKAGYLHFATHGLLNATVPMYSAIALTKGSGNDGLLEAREIVDMELHSDMVVLSACETALGKQANGEGILGLTWALFVAGTPSSVVSQWSVDDVSTSRLMVEFYRNLRSQAAASQTPQPKVSKSEALRQAQLRLLHDKEHAHPYYWAPFILVGEWH